MDPLNQQSPSYSTTNPTPSSQSPQTAYTNTPPEHKKIAPIVAILAVVLILIIAALYFFAANTTGDAIPSDTLADENAIPAETVKPVTSTSEDVVDIEADLNASIDGLDSQNF
jgi:hypothetical protein